MYTNEQLNALANLAQVSYQDWKAGDQPRPGYTVQAVIDDSQAGGNNTGAYALILRKDGTNDYVVDLRGTEPKSMRDWNSNLGLRVKGVSVAIVF